MSKQPSPAAMRAAKKARKASVPASGIEKAAQDSLKTWAKAEWRVGESPRGCEDDAIVEYWCKFFGWTYLFRSYQMTRQHNRALAQYIVDQHNSALSQSGGAL